MVDVITELARQGLLNEFLYDDSLVLMSETIEGFSKVHRMKQGF